MAKSIETCECGAKIRRVKNFIKGDGTDVLEYHVKTAYSLSRDMNGIVGATYGYMRHECAYTKRAKEQLNFSAVSRLRDSGQPMAEDASCKTVPNEK